MTRFQKIQLLAKISDVKPFEAIDICYQKFGLIDLMQTDDVYITVYDPID